MGLALSPLAEPPSSTASSERASRCSSPCAGLSLTRLGHKSCTPPGLGGFGRELRGAAPPHLQAAGRSHSGVSRRYAEPQPSSGDAGAPQALLQQRDCCKQQVPPLRSPAAPSSPAPHRLQQRDPNSRPFPSCPPPAPGGAGAAPREPPATFLGRFLRWLPLPPPSPRSLPSPRRAASSPIAAQRL